MPRFHYKAMDMERNRVKGIMEAEDEDQLYYKLRSEELFLVWCKEEKNHVRKRPLALGQLADFCRQLGVMMNSGIPILQAVNILRQRERNAGLSALYDNLYHLILRGIPLSEALDMQEGVFPALMTGMLRAGEESGKLADSALRLALYYERDDKLKKSVKGALIYPAFLIVLLVTTIITLFTVILPRFFVLFESMKELPLSTRILIGLSKGMLEYRTPCLFLLSAAIVVIMYVKQKEPVVLWWDKMILKLPAVGRFVKVVYTARFARTLNSLYASGVSLVSAVRTSTLVLNNSYLEKQLKPVVEDMCNGVPLATALSTVDGLDEKLVTGIFIGEESGELEAMLDHIATSFDYEAEVAAKHLTVLIEPVLIVLIAAITGFVMLAVMMPIYQYYETMG